MKKFIIVIIIVSFMICFLFIFSCKKSPSKDSDSLIQLESDEMIVPVADQLNKKMDHSISSFQNGLFSQGAQQLIEGVLLVKPSDQWPKEFENIMQSAKLQFKQKDFGQGKAFISNACLLLEPTREETENKDQLSKNNIQNLSPAERVSALTHQVTIAKDQFTNNRVDKGILTILKSLLLLPSEENQKKQSLKY